MGSHIPLEIVSENRFSGKTYYYTILPWGVLAQGPVWNWAAAPAAMAAPTRRRTQFIVVFGCPASLQIRRREKAPLPSMRQSSFCCLSFLSNPHEDLSEANWPVNLGLFSWPVRPPNPNQILWRPRNARTANTAQKHTLWGDLGFVRSNSKFRL